MNKFSAILCCLIFTACTSHKTTTQMGMQTNQSTVEDLAKEKYGENYFVLPNATNQYSLIKSNTKTFKEIGFDISYILVDHETNSIIMEDFLKSGYVNWEDEVNIKAVSRTLDKTNTRQKEVYLYNAQTRLRKTLK